ncbi:12518_t:CDS:1, partial [Ambispora leptoticha]
DKLDDEAIVALVQEKEAIEEDVETVIKPIIISAEVVKLINNLTSFLTHEESHMQISEKYLCELKVLKECCVNRLLMPKSKQILQVICNQLSNA